MRSLCFWLLSGYATACHLTLYPSASKDTNLWEILAETHFTQSPFVVCLTASDLQHRFIIADTSVGCFWTAPNLILQSLCESSNCPKQTIWQQGLYACWLSTNLTFINVTLSGRDHFKRTCDKDWCTHCQYLDYLVLSNSGVYTTVIDHYPITLDENYEAWQTKCTESQYESVFALQFGAMLEFRDCNIEDVRFGPASFVLLQAASVKLERTSVLRVDVLNAFIKSEDSLVTLEDCYITGLNRDHAYTEADQGGFLVSSSVTNLTILRSVFHENLSSSLFDIFTANLSLANTNFTHCTGSLYFYLTCSTCTALLSDLTIHAHFSEYIVLRVFSYDYTPVQMTNCRFSEITSFNGIMTLSDVSMRSVVFADNRLMFKKYGFTISYSELIRLFGGSISLFDCLFENNGAFRVDIDPYWTDYYVYKALLNANNAKEALELLINACASTLIISSMNIIIQNSRFAESSQVCNITLALEDPLFELGIFTAAVNNTIISSSSNFGFTVLLRDNNRFIGLVRLENSKIEGSAVLMVFDVKNVDTWVQFQAVNVAFERASGALPLLAPVTLHSVSATLTHCSWLYNSGVTAGALAVSHSNATLQHCKFSHNDCWAGPGDLFLQSEANVEFIVGNCTFTGSKSALKAATIRVNGDVAEAVVVIANCVFSWSIGFYQEILKINHNSGTVFLRNLTFLNSSSETTSLIVIEVPTANALPARTIVEDLKVANSTFQYGIVLNQGVGLPIFAAYRSLFRNNIGSLIRVETGNFTDYYSIYEGNSGSAELYYQGPDTFTHITEAIYQANSFSGVMGLLYIEGKKAVTVLEGCEVQENTSLMAIGVVQVENEGNVTFTACRVVSNEAYTAILYIHTSSTLLLLNCICVGNSDLLKLDNSQAVVLASYIAHFRSSLGTISLYHNSTLSLRESSITQATGTAGCALAAQDSAILLENVRLEDINCESAVISVQSSGLTIIGGNMTQIYSATDMISLFASTLVLYYAHISETRGPQSLLSLTNTTANLTGLNISSRSTVQAIQGKAAAIVLDSCKY